MDSECFLFVLFIEGGFFNKREYSGADWLDLLIMKLLWNRASHLKLDGLAPLEEDPPQFNYNTKSSKCDKIAATFSQTIQCRIWDVLILCNIVHFLSFCFSSYCYNCASAFREGFKNTHIFLSTFWG